MSEQKEVKLLTAKMAQGIATMPGFNTRELPYRAIIPCVEAIATGDAATYNTQTHVVVERGQIEALVSAAQAVINRWDSPLWVQTGHTGEFIARLRTATKAIAGETK